MKNKVLKMYESAVEKLEMGKDIPLLLIRLVLAYGFYGTAMMKLNNIDSVAEWFGSMGIPFPTLNAYMAATTEISGVVLLTIGLFNRIISIPLIIVMLVAIFTVHISNGFEAGNNGFEIPLYYLLMLLVILFNGAGRISADFMLKRATKNS